MDAGLWKQTFMMEPLGVVVIIDPQVGASYGQLRALPLFVELGLSKYTFTTSWHTFEFVPYNHRMVHEAVEADDLQKEFPIIQFIGQDTEDRSQSDATKKLLIAQRACADNPLLVYVLESEQFALRQSTGSKGFIDEYELKRVYGYEQVFFRFCDAMGLPARQVSTRHSCNLMLHRLAWELRNEESLLRLADLFDYTRIPPTSWAWDLLERLAAKQSVRRDDRALARLLHPWIDSDISKVTSRLLAALQRFDYDATLIRSHRERLISKDKKERR